MRSSTRFERMNFSTSSRESLGNCSKSMLYGCAIPLLLGDGRARGFRVSRLLRTSDRDSLLVAEQPHGLMEALGERLPPSSGGEEEILALALDRDGERVVLLLFELEAVARDALAIAVTMRVDVMPAGAQGRSHAMVI